MIKRGVLLINLGSPKSPAVADVKRYLSEFLMDGRVIDSPWLVRYPLVNWMIIPRRAHASAEAYAAVWTKAGSPLVVTSQRVVEELRRRVDVPVELAMRYQEPSIEEAINNLVYQGVNELFVIPLFPHFAMSSFETAAERAIEVAHEQAPQMKVKVAEPFYDEPGYIEALVASAKPSLKEDTHLLFSFHGLPERHLRKADPSGEHCLTKEICCEEPNPAHKTCYRAHCFDTVRAFAKAVGLASGDYSVAFQSRLGREPWMKPYTDLELAWLAKSGVKKLAVICPAFVSDCLETLEEIGIRGREIFLANGGEEFTLIPCLNEHPLWIRALEKKINAFVTSAGGESLRTPTSERRSESAREASVLPALP
jgi:ferrochelatase